MTDVDNAVRALSSATSSILLLPSGEQCSQLQLDHIQVAMSDLNDAWVLILSLHSHGDSQTDMFGGG